MKISVLKTVDLVSTIRCGLLSEKQFFILIKEELIRDSNDYIGKNRRLNYDAVSRFGSGKVLKFITQMNEEEIR